MSFVGKAISAVGKAVGLIPKTPKFPSLPSVPGMSDAATAAATDAAAQSRLAAAALGGRTSTMLTGGAGEDETALKTSKILLGQ